MIAAGLRYGTPMGISAAVRTGVGHLSKQLVLLIPLAMAAGLLAGALVDLSPLKVLVLPLTMLMVYPMLVTMRPREALDLTDAKAVGLAMALDLLVLPLVAWAFARMFFEAEPGLFVGMVLAGLFPTSGITISWTGFAKGNVAGAVKMTVIGLVAASLLAPFYLLVLAGRMVPVDLAEFGRTVLFVVGAPFVLAQATRLALVRRLGRERFQRDVAPLLPGISTLGVLGIVFLAIGLKARMILSTPALVLATAYIVQVQPAEWYVRLTDRIFGAPDAAAPAVPAGASS